MTLLFIITETNERKRGEVKRCRSCEDKEINLEDVESSLKTRVTPLVSDYDSDTLKYNSLTESVRDWSGLRKPMDLCVCVCEECVDGEGPGSERYRYCHIHLDTFTWSCCLF